MSANGSNVSCMSKSSSCVSDSSLSRTYVNAAGFVSVPSLGQMSTQGPQLFRVAFMRAADNLKCGEGIDPFTQLMVQIPSLVPCYDHNWVLGHDQAKCRGRKGMLGEGVH